MAKNDIADLARRISKLETQTKANEIQSSPESARLSLIEEKLDNAKESAEALHKTINITLAALGLIVTLVTIGQGVVTLYNRQDAIAAKKEVETAVKEMEAKFVALASDAMKKPRLSISTQRGPLDGQIFEMEAQRFPFFPMFIENVGNKDTGPITVRLFLSERLLSGMLDLREEPSRDPTYLDTGVFEGSVLRGISIAAGDSWALDPELFPSPPRGTNVVQCKIQVFYGAEEPAEAKFGLRRKL